MDMNAVIHNARIKGLAGVADGIAVAYAVAAGAKAYEVPLDIFSVGLGIEAALAYLAAGLMLRQYLRRES